MDKSTDRTIVVGILISLIAVAGLVFLSVVRHSDGKIDDIPILEEHSFFTMYGIDDDLRKQ